MKKNTLLALFALVVFPGAIAKADYKINYFTEGTGRGYITGFKNSYEPNSIAELEAVAEPGYMFMGWGGSCSGMGTCTLQMYSDKNVTTYFMPNPNIFQYEPPKILFPTGSIPATTSVTVTWQNTANSYLTRMQDLAEGLATVKKNTKFNDNKETYSVIPGHTYRFWIYTGTMAAYSTSSSEVVFTVSSTPVPTATVVLPATTTPTIVIGQSSPTVLKVQKYLNANGFAIAAKGNGSKGKESSYYGALTAKAVIRFQKANALPTTGKLDALTLSYMKI